MIKANNPALKSWIQVEKNSDFSIQNIPFGIFSVPSTRDGKTKDKSARAATRIGDHVIDLAGLAELGYFDGLKIDDFAVFNQSTLNDFIGLGKPIWRAVRDRLSDLFNAENATLRDNKEAKAKILHKIDEVEMLLPVAIGDYTDFYSSIEHATNVGAMFRDPNNALLPNWKHIPVGYHGRSSSIIISGTPIHRPKGQTKADEQELPAFGPTSRLDFELEIAFITSKQTQLGESISTAEAEEHIFGLVLFNDWSARDIQKWEYVPLGPFLGKSFASSISPWIVTLDSLDPFSVKGPVQKPRVLPYLEYEGEKNYDINLEVFIQPQGQDEFRVTRSNFKYMYWNMYQQLAHQTVNGCNIRVGDMYASGTISGPTPDSYGSMLELAWKGTKPIQLPDGSERKFINDNDTVIMRGYAQKDSVRVGFGEVSTKVLPVK